MELAIIVGIVLLVFAAATATVLFEDRRAQRREALRRQARLARMGEVDPLAPSRLRVDG
ncbi:hypothetical protein [Amycolatopsis sp. CA-230715]|uniref:hypothetical protein n=1 Tax=Amycolatopsis sp. CA-230715 TaxID=2745196 RepID=UPI001C0185C4|nr:hypothetical protein [Amycolatopsis sp. CA-230715]QWF80652.1 hypothetical protein HUW46_04075 [Amycolatopsis sp. CA-230715]